MPTTRADLRAALRQDLRDEDSGAYLWADAVLNRHIAHAVQDIQLVAPLVGSVLKTLVAPVINRLTLAADLPATYLWIDAIEYPIDHYPQKFPPFREEPGPAVYLVANDPPAAGQVIRVWYAAAYTVGESSGNLPGDLDRVLLTGALGYALRDQAIDMTDKLGPREAPRSYQRLCERVLADYQAMLGALRQRNARPVWMPAWALADE